MGGQLDEHLLFRQPTISIILYVIALYLVCFFEMQINYDDDDDDDDDDFLFLNYSAHRNELASTL